MAFDKAKGFSEEETGFDIQGELATAYVPPGSARGVFSVLDPHRCQVLSAWASTLIPGSGSWPSGADVDSVEYIDQNISKAVRLRPLVLGLVDHSDTIASTNYGKSFEELAAAERIEVLEICERDRPGPFTLVMELVYEAYYRDSAVLKATQTRTGFRPRLPVDGFALPDYDQVVMGLLAEISERPSLVREVL